MSQLARTIQNNFTGGEFSGRMSARTDNQKYYTAVRQMQNAMPRLQGGVVRRSGSRYVSEVRNSAENSRIYEFSFNTEQNYVLEFGEQYMRVYRARGQVVEPSVAISAITQANPAAVTTGASHGYTTGDQVFIDGVAGMTELNNGRYNITVTGATTLTLDGVDSSAYTTYTSGGTTTKVFEVATPWGADDLSKLKFTQSADILFITHPDYQTREIARISDTNWTVGLYTALDGPYLDQNITATTLTPASTTGTSVALTASASLFAATDVGRLVRLKISGTWGWAKIVAFNSATSVDIDIESAMGATTATTEWRLGAWSDTTGWPAEITFFQQRLIFGRNSSQRSTFWGSKTADYNNHAPTSTSGTVADDNAVTYVIADTQVNEIRDIVSSESSLIIITSDAVHRAYGGNSAGAIIPITPFNIAVSREVDYGAAEDRRALRVGGTTMFVGRSARSVRAMRYSAEKRGVIAPRQEIAAEHILKPSVTEVTYQKENENIVWFLRTDGAVIGNTVETEESINAWHRHLMGGVDALVKSISCIPSPDAARGYDLWVIVERTINGATKKYIEYWESVFDADYDIQRDGIYVDSSISYNGFLSGTLTPGATTGTGVTFTASSSSFSSEDVGCRLFKYNSSNNRIAAATITGFNSATSVTATIDQDFDSTDAILTGSWALAKKDFSGLHHLEGEEVQVCADGASIAPKTVLNGAISINTFHSLVHIGYKFETVIEGLPVEVQGYGTSKGLIKQIAKVFVGLVGSSTFKFGTQPGDILPLPVRSGSDLMDHAPPLVTEDVMLDFPSGLSKEQSFYFLQDEPIPFELSYVAMEPRVNG